ncbi:MAG: xanthine dehydrogenase, partial [Gammaproteobacteria bacterium]|nr:xanthine dehydrogenase [Gammaproteobacteria bacterium]
MKMTLNVNGIDHDVSVDPGDTLLKTLRKLGFFSVKFGAELGETGADTILLDGKPVNAGSLLALQAEGHKIDTLEGMGEHPRQGWKITRGLHVLQQTFVDSGAIQCG